MSNFHWAATCDEFKVFNIEPILRRNLTEFTISFRWLDYKSEMVFTGEK